MCHKARRHLVVDYSLSRDIPGRSRPIDIHIEYPLWSFQFKVSLIPKWVSGHCLGSSNVIRNIYVILIPSFGNYCRAFDIAICSSRNFIEKTEHGSSTCKKCRLHTAHLHIHNVSEARYPLSWYVFLHLMRMCRVRFWWNYGHAGVGLVTNAPEYHTNLFF